jgi:uncharacterized protein with von Willebrand factor type A (vWA) domain
VTTSARNGPATLFAGVDRAIFASTFAERLRSLGVQVSLTSTERCARALGAVPAMTLDDLYWLLRVSLLNSQSQIDTFDRVFAVVFDTEMGRLPSERRGQQSQLPDQDDDTLVPIRRQPDEEEGARAGLPWATLPSVSFSDDDSSDDGNDDAVTGIPELRPSLVELDVDRPFGLLDERELQAAGELLEAAVTTWPRRRSRRRRVSCSGGTIALRHSMRRAMRTGGDITQLMYSRPKTRPRRVVMLLDVSGSMESYARAYLHVMRPLALVHQAEVFAFATELTRATPALRQRSPTEAIDQLTEAVGDRFAGTRVGASLRSLLHHRSWNTTVRGAVVMICSDGWDAGEPVDLERQMRRLSLLAHRVVWVNPRAAATGFEPLAGGMAAALPYCDAFLTGHTVRSMADVIDAITAA